MKDERARYKHNLSASPRVQRVGALVLVLVACVVGALLFAAVPAQAGTDAWSGSGPFATGVGNKVITALLVDPSTTRVLYAGTLSGTVFSYTYSSASGEASPTVTTQAVSAITTNTGTGNGTLTDLGSASPTAHGVCWSTSNPPTTSDSCKDNGAVSSLGAFTASITGLTAGTNYYARAFATNSHGTSYGASVSFASLATVSTGAVSSVGSGTATVAGTITSSGSATISDRGVCYGTSANPTNCVSAGVSTSPFSVTLNSLTANTLYYARAFVTNAGGTTYGSDASFTTLAAAMPTVSTSGASDTATTSITVNGNVTDTGGAAILDRGICYGASAAPSSPCVSAASMGGGAFSVSLSGLSAGASYVARAFARNSLGTAYGGDLSVTTLTTTSSASASTIGTTTVTLGGTVGSHTAAITGYGVCYGTSAAPTSCTAKASADYTGAFTQDVSGLTAGTLYYARAYTDNAGGRSYGADVSFTTKSTTSSASASNVAATSVTLGGVIDAHTAALTGYGVCYGASAAPTSCTAAASTDHTGAFTQDVSGLSAGTLYYARAFVDNAGGRNYGADVSFTTLGPITSASASTIGTTTVTLGGTVGSHTAAITGYGVCYGASAAPTSCASKASADYTGAFTQDVTGLTSNVRHYARAYVDNAGGRNYGADVSFTTKATVTTSAASSVRSASATLGGQIEATGSEAIGDRGLCYGTSASPTNCVSASGLVFSLVARNLSVSTTYYARAYAANDGGTSYGADVSFTTAPAGPPTVTSSVVTSLTAVSAAFGGEVLDTGGDTVSERGVCYSMSAVPATLCVMKGSTGLGSFSVNLNGLAASTQYTARAYAMNSHGTGYGAAVLFVTPSNLPPAPEAGAVPATPRAGLLVFALALLVAAGLAFRRRSQTLEQESGQRGKE